MKNFTMRKLLIYVSVLLFTVPTLVGCGDDYDDSGIKKEINDLKDRIAALETRVAKMNTEIITLKKIMDESVTVVKVEQSSTGYIITFSDNTTAEINHGTDGADGADGTDGNPGTDGNHAPVIGVGELDGVYYWNITTNGQTEWLMVNGNKLRVTGESITPVISVDAQGYWTISYDGGATSQRILDTTGAPVSAVADESTIGSLFASVTYDDNNVYFELSNGLIITVPVRSNFYMLLRKAPEISTFVYGETQTYEVEAVGVQKTVISKPDEWKVTYANNILTITAPTEAHSDCADLEGTVSIIYFSTNGQSDAVTMDVVVEPDYTGKTVGADFTIDITSITDKKMITNITPTDKTTYWYMGYATKENIDANGTDAIINHPSNGYLAMLGFYAGYGYLDSYAFKGDKTGYSLTTANLKPGTEYYAIIFGFNAEAYNCTLKTAVMTVPFKTKQPVVINTVYRINVSDITWNGASYTCVPSDDLGYFHGFIKKLEFDTYADDAAFMKSRIDIYKDVYRKELYEDYSLTWDDLTAQGTQNIVAPAYEQGVLYEKPLIEDTEYYIYAFSCIEGESGSPLSKANLKTGKFKPTQDCTFEITTTVDRQNVTVDVVPSNKNTNYMIVVEQRASYQTFENGLQFAVDDLVFAKAYAAANGLTLADMLFKGNSSETAKDLWAATGYIVCVYGCTEEGIITTYPTTKEFLTKGTIDEFSVKTSPGKMLKSGRVLPVR